jgi:archaellum component FlaC
MAAARAITTTVIAYTENADATERCDPVPGQKLKEAEAINMDLRFGNIADKIDATNTKIDAVAKDLSTKKDAIDTKIDAINTKIDASAKEINTKIDASAKDLNTKIDASAKEINTKIDASAKEINTKIDDVAKDVAKNLSSIQIFLAVITCITVAKAAPELIKLFKL